MEQILSTAFNGLFLYLGLALAFMVLVGVLRSPRFKGWAGEQRVQRLIRQRLNPLIYVDLHNVTLPTADGGSTQIDHLIFSPYGLFVLETKNFQGWIFGTEKQREWTQQIFKKRSKFQNPLRQNYKHIKTLQELLGMESAHVHSVIAFVGDCEFKTEMPPQVTRGDGFAAYIQSFDQAVWSPEQMQMWLDKLDEVKLQPGRATDKRHVAHVKQLQSTKQLRRTRARLEPDVQAAEPVKPVAPETVDIQLEPVEAPAPTVAQTTPKNAPKVVAASQLDEVPVCPQCAWPLRKLLMQRGPLAGQAIWRCTNAAVCQFVSSSP